MHHPLCCEYCTKPQPAPTTIDSQYETQAHRHISLFLSLSLCHLRSVPNRWAPLWWTALLWLKVQLQFKGVWKLQSLQGTHSRWKTFRYGVHAEPWGSGSYSDAYSEAALSVFRSLTSQRLLNSLCSIRSSSLVSLLTMVAWRGVLSRMDSPNAVPIPSVQIVTASCTQTQQRLIAKEQKVWDPAI